MNVSSLHNCSPLLSLRKNSPVVGTYEPNAFILSMRKDGDLDTLHSYGIHSIPHIGVYGNNYSIALPMILLSITPSIEFLRQLPPDSLNALDINLQHIYETAIIETARQIVDRALTLAKKRLHLSSLKWRDRNITTKVHYWGDIPELMVSSVTESNGYLQERVFAQENEYRDSKTFYDSEGMQVLMDEERMEQYDKNVIFENTSADTTWRQDYITFGENWRDDEEETRKVARKLVHKVIHLAHRRWDDIQQKSSIDYLIASTKRLKISISPSVSPPPTDRVPEPILVSPSKQNQAQDPRLQSRDPRLESRDPRLASRDPRLESQDPIFTVDSGINIFLNDDLSSSTSALYPVGSSFSENDFSSETFSRKRRQRSDSHEMTMQRDLAKVRLKLQARKHLSEPAISFQQLSDENSIESEEFPPPNDYNRSLMTHERRSVSEIIFDMRKLSIMEDHEEEDEPEEDEEDEEYTILEAITKPLQMIPDELEPNSKNRLINEPKPFTKCLNSTVPEFNTVETHCGLDPIPINNPHSHSDYTFNDSLFSKPLIHPDSHTIPNLDYYIIIHTHPPPGLCQKFLCNNTNEINLIYHCWLYRELPFDPSITVSQQVEMGVFDPVGVCPVHLDLMDGGIPFYYMEPRTVCVHDCCLSPENAQLQLSQCNQSFHSFISVASCDNQKVITFHFIPCNKDVERDVSATLLQCGDTLIELIEILNLRFPELRRIFQHLLEPLFIEI